jgi:hypothetical protein
MVELGLVEQVLLVQLKLAVAAAEDQLIVVLVVAEDLE